jgi:Domain of unknown function (DUF1906)
MTFGVDYAWGRPGATALKTAGAQFACRYLSHDTTGKNLSRSEADELAAAGIWIVVVWEDSADRALQGHAAGVADAIAAASQAAGCGMPGDRPIYFAVDFDATPAQQATINAYLDGAASVLGRQRIGIYGGFGPVSRAMAAGHAAWGWQTYAWSSSNWWAGAHINQYLNDQVINGVGLDYDRALTTDYGQWMPGISPATQEDDDMPTGMLADGQGAITPISLPRGRYKTIGFIADNGLQQLPAAQIRVAVHQGAGDWDVQDVPVDSAKGQTVITFKNPASTDGISVQRADAGNVHVAWEVS